ncbi:MAG TPA: hypothetical protein VGR45_02640 [Stellaceae bacterium]|nr:hypothetical protein [Stellaceae bacterium]
MSLPNPLLTTEEFSRRVLTGSAAMLANNFAASLDNPLWRELAASVLPPTRWQRLTAPIRRFWWRCEAAWEADAALRDADSPA